MRDLLLAVHFLLHRELRPDSERLTLPPLVNRSLLDSSFAILTGTLRGPHGNRKVFIRIYAEG
jgi:hypothetical protein